MRQLDETDAEIVRLLVEDGRRPYRDVAEAVDLSPPAVRDRIERLRELGVIRRFTVDVDRSTLSEGIPVLVEILVSPEDIDGLRDELAAEEAVEHVFTTADARLVVQANVPRGDVRSLLSSAIDLSRIGKFDVTLLTDAEWTPEVGGTGFALECAECGNTVTEEGEGARIGGTSYHFCCASCQNRFEERYEDLDAGT